jgi:hypothetical protein
VLFIITPSTIAEIFLQDLEQNRLRHLLEGKKLICITNFVIVAPEHVDLMPFKDGQLTEACKGNEHLQIESHWMVLTIIL